MDPAACLQWLLDAIREGDIGIAMDHLDDYREWRNKGGFEPDVTVKGDAFADLLASTLRRMMEGV